MDTCDLAMWKFAQTVRKDGRHLMDAANRVYIADTDNDRVEVFSTT